MSHEIIKSYKTDLSLQVSVLAKMSSSVAKREYLINPFIGGSIAKKKIHPPIFGSKTFLNTENVSETGKAGFQVQLRALSEESWLAVII
jgi:hypothetical protein